MRASIYSSLSGAAAADPTPTGAEHGVPPSVLKAISQIKATLRSLREEIRNEGSGQMKLHAANGDGSAAHGGATQNGSDLVAAHSAEVAGCDAYASALTNGHAGDSGASPDGVRSPDDSYFVDGFDSSAGASPATSKPQSRAASRSVLRNRPATHRAAVAAANYAALNFVPPSPHIGRRFSPSRADPLSGESSVLGEGMALRMAAAAPEEAAQTRRSVYDAYVVEKEAIWKRDQGRTESRAQTADGAVSSHSEAAPSHPADHDGAPAAADDYGADEFEGAETAAGATANDDGAAASTLDSGIDYSKFAHLVA
jgi:hypothetical protein